MLKLAHVLIVLQFTWVRTSQHLSWITWSGLPPLLGCQGSCGTVPNEPAGSFVSFNIRQGLKCKYVAATQTVRQISQYILPNRDQVYSNKRVPTQVSKNQHKLTWVRYESTQARQELTRVQFESNASSTQVNTNHHESKTGLDYEKEKNLPKRKKQKRNLSVVWKTAFIKI